MIRSKEVLREWDRYQNRTEFHVDDNIRTETSSPTVGNKQHVHLELAFGQLQPFKIGGQMDENEGLVESEWNPEINKKVYP